MPQIFLKVKLAKHLFLKDIFDFEFDDFSVEELRLDKNIEKGGNFKN